MSVDGAFRAVERIADRLQQNPQAVERGVYMAERIGSHLSRSAPHFVAAAERLPHLSNASNNVFGGGDRIAHIAERSLQVPTQVSHRLQDFERHSQVAQDRFTKHHRSEAEQKAHDKAADNLDQLGQAGADLLEALGWGAAGNTDQAGEKAADAAGKIWDVFTRGFWGPGND